MLLPVQSAWALPLGPLTSTQRGHGVGDDEQSFSAVLPPSTTRSISTPSLGIGFSSSPNTLRRTLTR